jgi:pantoate--beta-alanine ligase
MRIVGCPIVRERDGLAMSSRNVYLSAEERAAATSLSRGLRAAAVLFAGGWRDAAVLAAAIADEVESEPLARLDYAVVVDDDTFDDIAMVERPARALVAARVGKPV